MNLSIQPLDSDSQPKGAPTLTTWDEFLAVNGFDSFTIRDMKTVLDAGDYYFIGGGAAGEFRISRVP